MNKLNKDMTEIICDNCKGKGVIDVRSISLSREEIHEGIDKIPEDEFEKRLHTAFKFPCQNCNGTGKIKIA